MKKRKPNFIVKTTSNHNETLKPPARSSKKTEKNHTTILGWIERSQRRRFYVLHPFNKEFPHTIVLKDSEIKKFNCKLHGIVRVNARRQKGHTWEGQIVSAFESLDDVKLELAIVAENHGLPTEFPESILHQSEELQNRAPGKRKDLTQCVTVTIDGETAKDFDDAISVERIDRNTYNLKVSIADVSHYVRPGDPIDKEAYLRGTSVYFPGFCVPMLPEILSNHLCSLVPYKERCTLTCEMVINKRGEIQKSTIYPSLIKSQARLTYTQVGAFLEKGTRGLFTREIEEMLEVAAELSLALREKRKRLGALDLDLSETEMEVDDTGDVIRLGSSIRNEAHRLIEDFMVTANEGVSAEIEKRNYSSIFRIHETPDPEKMRLLESILKTWGFRMDLSTNTSHQLQKFLVDVRGHSQEKSLIVSVLRSMKKAIYSPSNVGHFGLGSESYCHFTSPIRRYPDLMIHRILRNSDFLAKGKEPFSRETLAEISEQCSITERRAFLAERDMEDLKKCRFMTKHVGKTYDGFVTTVKSFGMFVEIEPFGIEGLIPLRHLPIGDWNLDQTETQLTSRRSKISFRLGDRIKIRVYRVDRLKRQIDFVYINHIREP